MPEKFSSHNFHAEAHALSGKLKLPFVQEIKKQAFVKLEGPLADLPDEVRAQRNYFSQHSENYRLEGIISYASAHTQVAGHASDKHEGASVTLATAAIEDLNILNVITADRVVAQIATTHIPGELSPHVTFLGTHFDNLRIATHKAEPLMRLDLAGKRAEGSGALPVDKGTDLMRAIEAQYQRLKTSIGSLADRERQKMRLRDSDSLLAQKYHGFHLDYDVIRDQATSARDKDRKWDGVTGSLVEQVEILDITLKAGDGRPIQVPAPARTFGHVIHVPDFGNIFLAELAVNHNSYNLTMMRLELGCLAAGRVSIAAGMVGGRGVGGGGGNGSGLAGDAATGDRRQSST